MKLFGKMNWHVHLYKVIGKAELNIEADTEKEALEKALKRKDEVKYGKADFSVLAQGFPINQKQGD